MSRQLLISEDGAVFYPVDVRGPGERQGTTAYTFPGHDDYVYAAESWRIAPEQKELQLRFAIKRCDALERMATELQRHSAVLFQHAADLRHYLETSE